MLSTSFFCGVQQEYMMTRMWHSGTDLSGTCKSYVAFGINGRRASDPCIVAARVTELRAVIGGNR